MIVVDASVWIDYLRGASTAQCEWLESNLDREFIAITDLTLCEVLQGVRDERIAREVRESLCNFDVLVTGGTNQAIEAAAAYRALRRRGITVRKTIDTWLATFCIRNGHRLLHNDRDFDPFAQHLGLAVVALGSSRKT